MTDPAGPAAPPPGWYRERPDAPELRWWTGRGWTEHRNAPIAAGRIEQPALPAGTRVGSVWIWLLSLLPLASLAAEQPVLLAYGPIVREQVRLQREMLAHPSASPQLPGNFGDLGALFALSWGLSAVLIGLAALAAYFDWRALRRHGIIRPFPWGWGFLAGVYIVGRAVVVRRRVGRGLAPLWVAVVLFVAAMVIQFAEFLSILAAAGAFATP